MGRKKWTSEKIYSRLLNNKSQKTYWDNVRELRSRPNQEVFESAYTLTKSRSGKEKIIGIHVLAQLGINTRPFLKETLKRYFELLDEEKDAEVLMSLLYAIGHNNDNLTSSQISKIVKFKNHHNSKVRHSVVSALLAIEKESAINTLIELMNDNIASIRNWATFGIGTQIEVTHPKITKALWKNVNDKHQETMLEAIVGLANRNDISVKDIVIRELEKVEYGTLLFDAIETINDKVFLPYLEKQLIAEKSNNETSEEWIEKLKGCIKKLKA